MFSWYSLVTISSKSMIFYWSSRFSFNILSRTNWSCEIFSDPSFSSLFCFQTFSFSSKSLSRSVMLSTYKPFFYKRPIFLLWSSSSSLRSSIYFLEEICKFSNWALNVDNWLCWVFKKELTSDRLFMEWRSRKFFVLSLRLASSWVISVMVWLCSSTYIWRKCLSILSWCCVSSNCVFSFSNCSKWMNSFSFTLESNWKSETPEIYLEIMSKLKCLFFWVKKCNVEGRLDYLGLLKLKRLLDNLH